MILADLPLLPEGARRIPFALASAWQAAQALTYATELLAAHFPGLDWDTWSDTFRQVKPELVVQGPAVWLEGPALEHLVQRLAASSDYPVPDPFVFGPVAAEIVERTAPQALAQQAQDDDAVARGHAATREPTDETPRPDPLVLSPPPASAASGSPAVDVPVAGVGTPPPPVATPVPPAPERGLAAARRTFSDIVQRHPRADGKKGFTVRELCRAMRISAASLREAHANPGRLSLKAVSALATLMQEPLLPVLADLLAGAGPRKKRRNQ
jgi:hypothetical protein